MVIYRERFGFFYVNTIYHALKPSFKYGLLCDYRQLSSNENFSWLHREEMNTLINPLTISEDEIFNSYQKKTQYEIRRSVKDNIVSISTFASIKDFIILYNRFASTRGWKLYRIHNELLNFLHVTSCNFNGETVIAHLYLLDKDCGRVTLSSSVSVIDEISDISIKALIGRANRHLHYIDMLYFKKCGFNEYDFGGYDTSNINDPKKIGINKFKEGFGGNLVYESNYTTYPLYWLFHIKKKISKLKIYAYSVF